MDFHFSIEYVTRWEEQLRVELTFTKRSGATFSRLVQLSTADGICWQGDYFVAETDVETFSYTYQVCEGETVTRREWNAEPRLFSASAGRSFVFYDYWRDIPELAHLYSSACGSVRPASVQSLVYFEHTLLFRVQAPQLAEGEALALVGNQPPLGEWRPERALRLMRTGRHEWSISLTSQGLYLPIEYKYVRVREKSGELLEWESGENRRSPSQMPEGSAVVTIFDSQARLAARPWRLAGVVVPMFSLRSEGSQGVGDFGDLRSMVDWAHQVGMRAVQLLPINDTTQSHTWFDSYPYNCVSVFALHPLYIDLRQLPPLHDKKLMQRLTTQAKKLQAEPTLNYEKVMDLKFKFLHALYDEQGRDVMRADSFQHFYDDNQRWLLPYAVFCTLRERFGTADFRSWSCLSHYDEDEARLFARSEWDEVGFHVFVQYLLDGQLSSVAAHARRLGVVLKGDIPIGISPCSVEAWTEPHLFHLDVSAGAPPDAFSATGQNWGFPTYHWERMAQDGYLWWRRRLERMSHYFDAYRIDHVLGFFRIWSVPRPSQNALMGQFDPALPMSTQEIASFGLTFRSEMVGHLFVPDRRRHDLYHPLIVPQEGLALSDDERAAFDRIREHFFYHRHNDFWYAEAMKKLPALVMSTRMLCCAEDLGMVPACVRPVMERLGMLSLEIQTMPKAYGVRFARLEENPVRSVCTIFTHDMPTLRQWWEEDYERAQAYYSEVLMRYGEAPRVLSDELAEEIVQRHLASPSMLCLISLQDWLATDERLRHPNPDDERINVPAVSRHYWRYRMHLTLEQLSSEETFCSRVRQMVERSGRAS